MVDDPVLRFALAAHTQTVKSLMDYIEGRGSVLPPLAAQEESCVIRRWFDSEGARYAHLPAYARAKEAHARFHQSIEEIVALLEAGAKAEAMAKLRSGSAFARLSRQMLLAFGELSEAIATFTPHS